MGAMAEMVEMGEGASKGHLFVENHPPECVPVVRSEGVDRRQAREDIVTTLIVQNGEQEDDLLCYLYVETCD